ncbi:MAG: hypothetical protein KAW52_03480 [candidate division Zixibacteria bacterium]|nr:hypothetical protein [candidate division Zixibacteria bacterium]
MRKIKKILLIFVVDTLVMLVSWAGLSLILLGVRVLSAQQVALMKMLSVYSFFVVMFCYAFYLIFDLCEYLSTEIRFGKMKGQMLEESTKEHSESKLLLYLVFTRMIKVIAVCLILTLIFWLLWLQEYVWGFFLLGASLGFLVFWVLGLLKHHLGYQQDKESSGVTEEVEKLADPKKIRSKTPVED